MKKSMTEIEVGKFRPLKDEMGYALPFAIFFVYTESLETFVVKGMSKEVKQYVHKTFPRSFYRYTYWKNGVSRGGWSSPMSLYIFRREHNGRLLYEISAATKDGFKSLKVRRVPTRWLPMFGDALGRKHAYVADR